MRRKKDWSKDMALQRIDRLFELAHDEFKNHPERSNRYVQLAKLIGMRYRIRLPAEMKNRICKHCHFYLVDGSNARTRLQGTHIATTCNNCGKQMRRPY
jgi:ribonuclease P protein subunit RPR2